MTKKEKKTYRSSLSNELLDKDSCIKLVLTPEKKIIFDINFEFNVDSLYLDLKKSAIRDAISERLFESYWGIESEYEVIVDNIISVFKNKILDYASLARKSGFVVFGKNRIIEELKKDCDKFCILQACDTSEKEKFTNKEKFKIVEIFDSYDFFKKFAKENVHFILVYGKFADIITNLFINLNKFNKE